MIALDTNVLARYLVRDNTEQAEAARSLLESLTADLPGYVCCEVTVELAWVLKRAYGYSRDQIATVLEELVATEGLVIEAADDVARAAFRYRTGSAGFSDLMILAQLNDPEPTPCIRLIRRQHGLRVPRCYRTKHADQGASPKFQFMIGFSAGRWLGNPGRLPEEG